jgi:Ca2+-binding RTX toxin-like protein
VRRRLELEVLESRRVPTVRLVSGGGLELTDDPGVTNGFKVDVQGSDLVVTDRGQGNRFAVSQVNYIKANFDTDDSILVDANAGKPVHINTGRGTVNVDLSPNGRFLDRLSGTIEVNANYLGGVCHLRLHDQNNPHGDTYTVTDGFVRRPFSATVNYRFDNASVSTLTLSSGSARSTFNVESTSRQGCQINTGPGSDLVNVGRGGSLDGIRNVVSVDGGGAAVLTAHDSAAAVGSNYNVAGNVFVKFGAGAVGFQNAVVFQNMGSATLLAGSRDDSFNLFGPSAFPVTVNAGGGSDLAKGVDVDSTWSLDSSNAGTYTPVFAARTSPGISFREVENLMGGTANDTYRIGRFAALAGFVSDRGGTQDTLDYGAQTEGVRVDLRAGSASRIALGTSVHVAGIENVAGGLGDDRIWGDDRDNDLSGGGGSDVLVGRGGNDQLYGGSGRSLLIGGTGSDFLNGGGNDDILIGGTTDHDENAAALDAIMALWTDPQRSYQQRVLALSNSHLNGRTVHDDGSDDILEGGGYVEGNWKW